MSIKYSKVGAPLKRPIMFLKCSYNSFKNKPTVLFLKQLKYDS